jgi:hypothetical protein
MTTSRDAALRSLVATVGAYQCKKQDEAAQRRTQYAQYFILNLMLAENCRIVADRALSLGLVNLHHKFYTRWCTLREQAQQFHDSLMAEYNVEYTAAYQEQLKAAVYVGDIFLTMFEEYQID